VLATFGASNFARFVDCMFTSLEPPLLTAKAVKVRTQKEVLNFKPAPRLEQIDDKCSKQVDDRKHRIGSCSDFRSPRESRPDRIFGNDTSFPHVFSDNAPAIALYHRMGLRIRRRLYVTVLGNVS
jgi:hypothetical protein